MLTQIGAIVGVGVLVDTLLVWMVVVSALALLLGERFWWPAWPGSHVGSPAGSAAELEWAG